MVSPTDFVVNVDNPIQYIYIGKFPYITGVFQHDWHHFGSPRQASMIIPIESRVVDFLELPGQGLAVAGLQHAA
jgi:hypothetical protein